MAVVFFAAGSAFTTGHKTKLTLTASKSSADTVYDEAYVLTVPTDFNITASGWNSLGNITVKYSGGEDGFDPKKKLVITATTSNDFKLVASGVSDTVSYFLATGVNDKSATKTFEFTADEITAEGTSKAIGVNVEDYASKPEGTYEDEITYTVELQEVEDADSPLLSLTVTDPNETGVGSQTFYYVQGETWQEAVWNHVRENSVWDLQDGQYVYHLQYYRSTGMYRYIAPSSASEFTSASDIIDGTVSYIFKK